MIRKIALIAVAAGVSWWLFADTARHVWGEKSADDVLRFSHFGSYQDYETWGRVIEAFEAKNPDITVRREYVPGFGSEYDNKIRRQVLAGVAADVLLVQDESFPQLATRILSDLSDVLGERDLARLQAEMHPTGMASFTHQAKPFALPLYGGNLLIYLNRRCLENAARHLGRAVELPSDDWSIADFRSLCRDLTCDFDGDGRIDQFGLWHPWWGYYLPFVWSMGAEVLDETRRQWRLTGPAAEDAFRLYADLLLSDRVCPAPGELGQMRQDIAFLTGRVAMVINGPWLLPLIEESSLGEAYFVAHIPRGPGGRFTRVTWDGIAINRHTPQERREAAGRFVLFACSKQAQDIFAGTRRWIPARVESRLAKSPHDENTGADKFSSSFDYLRMQPITSHWKQMDRAIQRHLRKLLSGESEARDVLEDLADDPAITEHFSTP